MKGPRERTRRNVVEAAGRLFGEQGYTGTTVAAIATAAGVAPSTVYASVGGKPALLGALAMDPEADARMDQALARAARASAPRQALRLIAAGAGASVRRRQAVWTLLLDRRDEDAAVDEAARALLLRHRERLDLAAARLAPALDPSGPDVGLTLRFYLGVPSWRTARGLGWSWDGAARWLGDRASTALRLPDPPR